MAQRLYGQHQAIRTRETGATERAKRLTAVAIRKPRNRCYENGAILMAGALLATGRIDRASVAVGAARIVGGTVEYAEQVALSAYDSALASLGRR